MRFANRVFAACAVAALTVWAGGALAAAPVKIGVILPLSGNAAGAGTAARAAIELGAEIVNGAHPDLSPLPLAATAGLPNLGGAKIELVVADHQGNPSVGQSQTLRLITQDKVAAMLRRHAAEIAAFGLDDQTACLELRS